MENASARNLWGDYLDQHIEYAFAQEPHVNSLSEDKDESQRQLKLILSGKKRAFSHSLLGLQYRKEKLPKIGDFTIITDIEGNAK
ncbi:MAG: ASCH domain-containing protein, partial [Eudoraea sp.]